LDSRYTANSLISLGLCPKYKGYIYVNYAIELAVKNTDKDLSLTDIYKEIAKRFGVKPAAIQTDIRKVLEGAWYGESNQFIRSLFCDCDYNKLPSNGAFLGLIILFATKTMNFDMD